MQILNAELKEELYCLTMASELTCELMKIDTSCRTQHHSSWLSKGFLAIPPDPKGVLKNY